MDFFFNLCNVITCDDIEAAPKSISQVFLGGKLLLFKLQEKAAEVLWWSSKCTAWILNSK